MALDLELLQGQVSSMRGSVKQVKTHLIHKLTRDAKKLREKKGTEEQKKQNGKKADRIIEEVMIMKKIQPDEVSKFVLKTDNCGSVISKPNIPLEMKVLARFGTHKILSPIIDKFRSEHPTWKDNIHDLVLKIVIEPKQTLPAHNHPANRSVIRTPGNNIFSVTPVKQSGNSGSQRNQALNTSKKARSVSANAENVAGAQKGKLNENSSKGMSSKMNGAGKNPTAQNLGNENMNAKKRQSFMDSSTSSEGDESEDSGGIDQDLFQKALKRQRPESQDGENEDSDEEEEGSEEFDESEEMSGESDEEEGSGEDDGSSEDEGSKEDSDEGESNEEESSEESLSDKAVKQEKPVDLKVSGPSRKRFQTDGPAGRPPPFRGIAKQSKLDEELDEVERRLNKGKSSKHNLSADDTVEEESVDPFFVTTEGQEYISSAPAPKTEDKPSGNFSQNTSTPKEFYRKGKKVTPYGQERNFGDRNNRGRFGNYQTRGNYQSRGNYQNRGSDRRSFGHHQNRDDSFNRDDRKSFGRGGNRSFNGRGNFSNFNDRRNSFNRNDDRSFNSNDKGNSFNDDRRNSFNRNDNQSFNRSNRGRGRGKPFNQNDRRSASNSDFNSRDKFSNRREGPKFDTRRQDSGGSEHLHPSWEAKKKMSSLAAFQGKKIVFND